MLKLRQKSDFFYFMYFNFIINSIKIDMYYMNCHYIDLLRDGVAFIWGLMPY